MSQSSHNNLTSANAGIDQLVKEYLKEKGYHKALEAMEFAEKQKKQSQKDDQVVPLYQPADSDGVGEEGKPMDIDDDSAADKNQSSRKRPVAVPHKVMAESLISNKAASLYVIGIREGDPNVYLEEYGQFHHWTSQSIDLVSPYLEAVGFAAFITW
jgi:hypothetical protein